MEKKKILIVDDEEDILGVQGKRLSNAGYSVIKATNGKDAVIMARSRHPDLIILDIIMPGMDGSEAAAVLKEDPAAKNIPIIFLTCMITRKEGAEKIIGGNYFISKPYNPEDILREIDKHIGK